MRFPSGSLYASETVNGLIWHAFLAAPAAGLSFFIFKNKNGYSSRKKKKGHPSEGCIFQKNLRQRAGASSSVSRVHANHRPCLYAGSDPRLSRFGTATCSLRRIDMALTAPPRQAPPSDRKLNPKIGDSPVLLMDEEEGVQLLMRGIRFVHEDLYRSRES